MQRVFDFLHRNIIVIIIAVVVFAGAVSTVAIVRGDKGQEQPVPENVTYQTVSKIFLAMDRVETLNPLVSEDRDVYYISQLVFSSLFRLDDTLNVEPDLTDTYETDPAGGSVSIRLKDSVKFSDGSRLTASDVKYTVDKIQGIGESSPYYSYAKKIDRIEVEGDRMLTVYFEKPSDAALDNLVFPIVSASSYDTKTQRVCGSGQYAYGSYDSKEFLKLKPNAYYYGKKAENRIEFKVVDDKDRVSGLMTMEAVTAYVSRNQDADTLAEDRELKVKKIPSCELEYLGFNFRNRHLKEVAVRQAIAKSIDTETLIRENYGGAAVQSDALYFPGFLGTENQKDAYAFDPKGASDLLRSAGYRDSDEDGVLEDAKKRKLSLKILVNSSGSRMDTAGAIADALKETGIDARVETLPWDEYREAVRKGAFDLYLGGYKLDKQCDLRMLFRNSAGNGYKNQEVKAWVNRLETCLTAKEQKAVYEELKTLLNRELPYYGLCYKTYAFITVDPFHAEVTPTFFDVFRGCSTWTWEKTITRDTESEGTESAEKTDTSGNH